jgi:hypothetical protein
MGGRGVFVAGEKRRGQGRSRTAGVRVAQPFPLRTFGIAATAGGAFLIEANAVRGPAAVIGLAFLAVGLAAFDALDRGRIEPRHAGMVAAVIGGGLGSWSLVIVALLALLGIPVDTHLWLIMASGALGVIVGVILIGTRPSVMARPARRRPQSVRGRAAGRLKRSHR